MYTLGKFNRMVVFSATFLARARGYAAWACKVPSSAKGVLGCRVSGSEQPFHSPQVLHTGSVPGEGGDTSDKEMQYSCPGSGLASPKLSQRLGQKASARSSCKCRTGETCCRTAGSIHPCSHEEWTRFYTPKNDRGCDKTYPDRQHTIRSHPLVSKTYGPSALRRLLALPVPMTWADQRHQDKADSRQAMGPYGHLNEPAIMFRLGVGFDTRPVQTAALVTAVTEFECIPYVRHPLPQQIGKTKGPSRQLPALVSLVSLRNFPFL